MNYGYNLTEDVSLSNFIAFAAEFVSITITNSSFEYNIALNNALLNFARVKTITLDQCLFQFNIGGAEASVL